MLVIIFIIPGQEVSASLKNEKIDSEIVNRKMKDAEISYLQGMGIIFFKASPPSLSALMHEQINATIIMT